MVGKISSEADEIRIKKHRVSAVNTHPAVATNGKNYILSREYG